MENAVGRKVVASLASVVVTLLMMMLPSLGGAAAPAAAATGTGEGAPGRSNDCTRSCGNISIPYPFGIEPGCYHASWFNLTCNHSYQPAKLFLGDGTVQVLHIWVENSTVRINSTAVQFLYEYDGSSHTTGTANGTRGLGLPEAGPYLLSESASMLQAIVCVAPRSAY